MTLRSLRCLSPKAREEESSGSELRCLAMKWPKVIQPGEISMLMDEYTVFQLDALESPENIDEYWRAAFDLKKCDGTTKYPLLGIFNPENDDDMEEIMKMLESSDIECSSDDDDPDRELPERDVAAADDKEEQSQEDLDDAANTIAQTSACATQSAPSGKYIWKEEPFEEKSLPSFEYDLSEPPGNVRTPLEYFSEYFDDSFFQNAPEKTNMYCMSTTGEILKATPQKIPQLFGMHIIMGCIRLPNIHIYFTTIPLLDALIDKEIDATGTIMSNRVKNIHFESDTMMKQGNFQEFRKADGKAAIVKWKDSKSVTIASTCTGASPVESVKRWSKKTKQYIDVQSQAVVCRYNAFMGGVDVCDQLLEYYRISIKTKKWTLKVSLHMVDLSIVNAWMQYREDCRRNGAQRRDTMDLLQFRLAIGEALCASLTRSRSDNSEPLCLSDVHVDKAIRVAKISGVDIRIDGFDHFPTVDAIKNARCGRLLGCPSRSRTRCIKCNVYLCLTSDRNCFKMFHTKI
ncbi:hypothetical protein HPB51_018327 [Rhipicephalus microplus]|uniref:PiggyBac transposable element-derived protein domain-containing protein n=1 Tax=Rhipicephalus microplus TaxID=6941 RepID=A0A9J6EUF9_RHIMP|nr:hypothetical protein HPB51_018327 [Rhipicephalus microplus]